MRDPASEAADRVESLRAARLLLGPKMRRSVDDRAGEPRASVVPRDNHGGDVDEGPLAVGPDHDAVRVHARQLTSDELRQLGRLQDREPLLVHQKRRIATDDLLFGIAADRTQARVHGLDDAAFRVDHDQPDLCAGKDADEPRFTRLDPLPRPALTSDHTVDQVRRDHQEHGPQQHHQPAEMHREGPPERPQQADSLHGQNGTEAEAVAVRRSADHEHQQRSRQLDAVPPLERNDRRWHREERGQLGHDQDGRAMGRRRPAGRAAPPDRAHACQISETFSAGSRSSCVVLGVWFYGTHVFSSRRAPAECPVRPADSSSGGRPGERRPWET